MRTIPLIDDARLEALAARIRPVVKTAAGHREIEPVDLRGQAFTWSPTPTGPTLELEEVAVFQSFHNWGYYGFFKPSVAEVLAQIQDDPPEGEVFFWLDTSTVQQEGQPLLHRPDEHNRDGYHRATVHLLRRAGL